MRVVALDLSLTAIGVADETGTRVLSHKLPAHASEDDKCERLHSLSARVDVVTKDADLVGMEGYSFGSQHSHAHALGELGGLVKVILWRRGRRYVLISPSQIKKFATGKGNATKEQVLAAAVRIKPEIETTHEAEAFFIRMMMLGHYLNGDVIAPAYRAAVLQGIDWPVLRVQGGGKELASG